MRITRPNCRWCRPRHSAGSTTPQLTAIEAWSRALSSRSCSFFPLDRVCSFGAPFCSFRLALFGGKPVEGHNNDPIRTYVPVAPALRLLSHAETLEPSHRVQQV